MKKKLIAAGVIFSTVVLPLAQAQEDAFTPYVFARIIKDDNLFRLSNDDEALAVIGSTKLDETIQQLGAGFKADLPFSRQRLKANAVLYQADYSNFDSLDHTGSDLSSVLNWEIGNLFAGDLGLKYSRQLARFYELQAVTKDMRTRKTLFATGGYRFHPSWRAVVDFSLVDLSQAQRSELDRSEFSKAAELQWSTTARTRLGTRIRHTKGNFDDSQIVSGSQIDNDFSEMEYSVVLYWERSKKSLFEGRVGVTQRDAKSDAKDFNGSTGQLNYAWLITDKTRIDSAIWRKTTTREELTVFVVANGLSIAPKWSATRKIQLGATLEYEARDFKGTSDSVALVEGTREDTVRSFGLSASYNPQDNIAFSMGYDKERRDSNFALVSFRSTQLFARAQLSF